jgi:hypothetical protein
MSQDSIEIDFFYSLNAKAHWEPLTSGDPVKRFVMYTFVLNNHEQLNHQIML